MLTRQRQNHNIFLSKAGSRKLPINYIVNSIKEASQLRSPGELGNPAGTSPCNWSPKKPDSLGPYTSSESCVEWIVGPLGTTSFFFGCLENKVQGSLIDIQGPPQSDF